MPIATALAAALLAAAPTAPPGPYLQGAVFTTPGMMVEGIAAGKPQGTIYASDLYGMRLVKRTPEGRELAVPVPPNLGIVTILGLKLSENGMRLWACAQRRGEANKRTAALIEADPKTLRVINVHNFPKSDSSALCNDLDFDGRAIILTESEGGKVWRFERRRFIRLGANMPMEYPNGIAVDRTNRIAFVAHSKGIARIDMWTGEATPLVLPAGQSAAGIDGLYYKHRTLYGVQNVLDPMRVVRIDLDWERKKGVLHVLAGPDPRLPLPTTAAFVGRELWLVADAQFLKLDDNGKLKSGQAVARTRLMRLPF